MTALATFRTVIRHPKGGEIALKDEIIKLKPDEDGYCTFEVEAESSVLVLLNIPEGFAVVGEIPASLVQTPPPADPVTDPQHRFVLTRTDEAGAEVTVDLSDMDNKALRAFCDENSLDIAISYKGNALRAAIVKAVTPVE